MTVAVAHRFHLSREAYNAEVAQRWFDGPLSDARRNWCQFEEHQEELVAILLPYLRDPQCEDVGGTSRNPQGTLTAWLWVNCDGNPWIWDFCVHYQKCHLRRGLIAYCKQLIQAIEAAKAPAEGQLFLFEG